MTYPPQEQVGDKHDTRVYYKHENGNGGFILGWLPGDGEPRFYQLLTLGCRASARRYLPAAARLYRRLKRDGVLRPWQTFKYVAM